MPSLNSTIDVSLRLSDLEGLLKTKVATCRASWCKFNTPESECNLRAVRIGVDGVCTEYEPIETGPSRPQEIRSVQDLGDGPELEPVSLNEPYLPYVPTHLDGAMAEWANEVLGDWLPGADGGETEGVEDDIPF